MKAIKECNKKEAEKESLKKEKIIYEIDFDDKSGFIKYKIKENSKIDRKPYKKEYDILYNYNIFNDKIIEILNKNELLNIEKELFKNILPKPEYSEKYYEKIKPIFNRLIKEILSSKAAINFFNNTYKKEYDNSNRKIEYHFNNEKVQNEILNRISFYPIFTETVNAFTNPLDLSIVINSIPGKYKSDEINYFNKKILNIGRIVLFATHEIMGHYLRRYYSFITDRDIRMDTEEDILIDTKPEGGEYIETNFLGFTGSVLYLKDILYFFGCKYFEKYPLKKNYEINEEILKIIINDYPDIFNFISRDEEKEQELKDDEKDEEDDEKDDEEEDEEEEDEEEEEDDDDDDDEKKKEKEEVEKKEKKKEIGQISLEQFISLLSPTKNHYPAIISCGVKAYEIYIIL